MFLVSNQLVVEVGQHNTNAVRILTAQRFVRVHGTDQRTITINNVHYSTVFYYDVHDIGKDYGT